MANVADPNDAYANPTLTMSMLGAPDNVGCSLGRGGSAVIDVGPDSEIMDGPGDEIQVYESTVDGDPDGYSLYGGESYLGSWTLIGQATGTASFDLSGTGLSGIRYLRIQDDGDGSSNATYAGFDLDALEIFGVSSSIPAVSSPTRLVLQPPSPNPVDFSRHLAIRFELPAPEMTRLEVLDVRGRRIALLSDRISPAGRFHVAWNGRDEGGRELPSGVYYVRLRAGTQTAVRTVVIAQ
jgi:hypothetical protein